MRLRQHGRRAAPVWEECGEPGPNDSFFHDIAFADLEAGPYTFQVRAIDVVGNADQTPAPVPAYEFGVEAEPETTIGTVTPDMGPDLQTDSTTVSFTFSGTGVSFECALDSATFTPCASPATYNDVPYGTHLFRVQAVAEFGTRDQTPAEFEWESGFLTPPDVTITSAPATGTTSTTATFEFGSSDPEATFLCTLDGVGPKPVRLAASTYTARRPASRTRTRSRSWPRSRTCSSTASPREHSGRSPTTTAPETVLLAPLPADPSAERGRLPFTGTDDGTPTGEARASSARSTALRPFEPCSSPRTLSS